MMTVPSRADRLREIVSILESHLGVHSPGAIDEDTCLFADLGLASIDAVVLSEALQNHYDRPLPFHSLLAEIGRRSERDLSIGELVAFLEKNL
jgi:acyl carrier protein